MSGFITQINAINNKLFYFITIISFLSIDFVKIESVDKLTLHTADLIAFQKPPLVEHFFPSALTCLLMMNYEFSVG